MTAPPRLAVDALLDPANTGPDWAGSWFITHGLGGPARQNYTEVAFTTEVLAREFPERVLDEAARQVAADLYGHVWAQLYRPDQYEQSIARHQLRRRERVIVTAIEVWDW